MSTNELFKQIVNFERKLQQLDKCNDAMSERDWVTLAEKLDQLPDTQKKIAKLAARFIKIGSEKNKDEPDDVHLLIKPNEDQKNNALDVKTNWIIDIDPSLFLDLTTDDGLTKWEIINKSKPLEYYLSAPTVVHPFLIIDKDTGKIKGHEGRHRAAATLLRKGTYFRVAIQLRPGGRNYRPKDMPIIWIGQFNSKTYDVKELIGQGKIKLVNDSVQKEFWRDNDNDDHHHH